MFTLALVMRRGTDQDISQNSELTRKALSELRAREPWGKRYYSAGVVSFPRTAVFKMRRSIDLTPF